MFSSVELKCLVLKRGLKVLPEMSRGTEEEDCIYDGGMTTLECYMEELCLIPVSERKWYVLSSPVSLILTLNLMEEMFVCAEKLNML